MCGIVGIYNFDKKDVKGDLIQMMMKLQHRGKDSFGISYNKKGGSILSFKKKGMVEGDLDIDMKNIYQNN